MTNDDVALLPAPSTDASASSPGPSSWVAANSGDANGSSGDDNDKSTMATSSSSSSSSQRTTPASPPRPTTTTTSDDGQRQREQDDGVATTLTTTTTKAAEFGIAGMTCGRCSRTVEQALLHQVDGIVSVSISLATNKALIQWQQETTTTGVGEAGTEPSSSAASPPRRPSGLLSSMCKIREITETIEAVGYDVVGQIRSIPASDAEAWIQTHMTTNNTSNSNDKRKKSSGSGCAVCGCPDCTCGDDCRCTETLCMCGASSLISAVKKTPSQVDADAAAAAAHSLMPRTRAAATATGSNSTSPLSSSPARRNNNNNLRDRGTATLSNGIRSPAAAAAAAAEDPLLQPQTPPRSGSHINDDENNNNVRKAELLINGMTCTVCSQTIEHAVRDLPDICSVAVSLTTDSAFVEWTSSVQDPVKLQEIQETIEAVGFDVEQARLLPLESQQVPATAPHNQPSLPERMKAELLIKGMTCTMCSQAIETAVKELPGVRSVAVSLATDAAIVEWIGTATTLASIQDTIEAIGYEVENARLLNMPQPVSPSRRRNVHVSATNNNDAPSSAQERWELFRRRQEKKVAQRRRAFLWSLVGSGPVMMLTMVLPIIVPAQYLAFLHREVHISWGGSSNDADSSAGYDLEIQALLLWILATPVQFISGWTFYKMAYYSFWTGKAGMDMLVAMSTTAAYGYALAGTFAGGHQDSDHRHASHFFETSCVLISFVLLGKWLQAAAVRRTSQALVQLMQLQATTAVLVTPQSEQSIPGWTFNPLHDPYHEHTVPIDQVSRGDMVKVIRGASIPADGRILYGDISVDESMVTGESLPVLKTSGSVVLGGTICVESGAVVVDKDEPNSNSHNGDISGQQTVGAAFIEVTGVGKETALAQIVQLVQDAQNRAVPIQNFADKISAVFVPTVSTISLLTYMVWYALCSSNVVPAEWYQSKGEDPMTFSLVFGIACLVVACPCALGLATPTAVVVGTSVGARMGVLMKGGETLEIASKVDAIVFDKTGTLTKGKPAITDIVYVDDSASKTDRNGETLTEKRILWLLGSLERSSEHPLARAVVTYVEQALEQDLLDQPFAQPSNFRALTGRGAMGTVQGKVKVAVGNRSFALSLKIRIQLEAVNCMRKLENEGKTAMLVSIDDEVRCVLGVADELKPDAAASIAFLQRFATVFMVTGDNRRTAKAISRQLGLSPNRVVSEAMPAAKVQVVRRLQNAGRCVLMVGDGVNDSPALAQADVGMSVGSGAEIAAEAADMVLVKGDVTDVCIALDLCHVIFRRIQWNFVWALLYNCLGIPIASGLFYPFVRTRLPPAVAAAAMALSSISVVLSSLSLQLYRPPILDAPPIRRSTTTWAQAMQNRRSSGDNGRDELTVDLLSSDHLAADNRTVGFIEEGRG